VNQKFKNKYRVKSNRMPGWNYAGNGFYFITLVTQNRVCYLGHIEDSRMVLSDIGKIVETEWYRSFELRDELNLDEWIMMPNHIHAIVTIQDPDPQQQSVETHGRASFFLGASFDLNVPHSSSKCNSIGFSRR
jgi:REP element-mobilizing transposase RayT